MSTRDADDTAREVFRLARKGMVAKEIAAELGLHVSNIHWTAREYGIAVPSTKVSLWPKPDEPGIDKATERWGRPAQEQRLANWMKATAGARETRLQNEASQ